MVSSAGGARPGDLLALMALAALLVPGGSACSGPAPTGIVVAVKTDLQVPFELDSLKIFVRNGKAGSPPLHQRDYKLGTGDGKLQLPASLALVAPEQSRGLLRVEVQGFFGPQLMIARSVHQHFVPEEVLNLDLTLGADCLGVYCPAGKTCQSGQGCVPVAGLATAADAPDLGPPCDCNSYFPVCRGALWTYEQRDLNRNIPIKKAIVVQDYAAMEDNAHQKAGMKGFLQFRLVEGGLSRRWLTVQGPRGAARLSYQKDEWFDNHWNRVLTSYFVPQRPRLDETHTREGETWTVGYEQFDYRSDGPVGSGWTRTDEWAVVPAREQPGLPKQWAQALCHRRLGQELADSAIADQIYCFVRGIGKVYEITAGDDEDVLKAYRVPGCGELQP